MTEPSRVHDLFLGAHPRTTADATGWSAVLDDLIGPLGSEVRVHPCRTAARDMPWEGTLVHRAVTDGKLDAVVIEESMEFLHSHKIVRQTIKWEHISHLTVLTSATDGDHEGRPQPALELPPGGVRT